jgi:uncharacterized integral membrane protein (TIGR00698 family)
MTEKPSSTEQAQAAKEASGQDVVVDRGETQLSDLWKKEDYLAIWLGLLILLIGIFIYFPRAPKHMQEKIDEANAALQTEAARAPFKTVAWYQASDAKEKVRAIDEPIGKKVLAVISKPHGWNTNALQAFYMTAGEAEAKKAAATAKYEAAKAKEEAAIATALEAQAAAEAAGFKDSNLNSAASGSIDSWRQLYRKASDAKKKTTVASYNQFPSLLGLMLVSAALFSIGIKSMNKSVSRFIPAFVFVFVIAALSYMMEEQAVMKQYGFGFPLWAIVFGLIISNTIGTPEWVKPAVQTEYYIKTGLVLLGAEILFGKIISIGLPGIFVAWVVTPIVLVVTYIFGQKVLKMASKTLNITICADMSVCGVSAAIATAAACRAKKEELTLAVGLSMVFTAIMMVTMPMFIKAVGMPHVLGGAWIGGTIDATGAVAAAGAFLSDRALYVAATVKMIQNILIGVVAFGVAVYWCARVDCAPGQKVSTMEIWYRFPKFVLGFIGMSILFSMLYQSLGKDVGSVLIDNGVIRGLANPLREWFFCLAFVSIGLATNFRELAHYFKGGKPLILYVCGQALNLILSLTMAYIMFYKVFPEITARI